MNANLRPDVTTITGVTTLSAPTDDQQSEVIRANGGASSYALSLPAASADMVGFYYQIKQLGTGTLSITPNGSDTIEGSTSPLPISVQYDARTLYCVAVNTWEIY